MSDAHTPASRHILRPTHNGSVQVHMAEERLHSVTLLSTWASGIDGLMQAIQQALDCTPPASTGQAVACAAGLLMRSGPLEFMLIGTEATPDRIADLRASIHAGIGSVLDLSHARVRLRLQGERVVDALAKLYALDFRPKAFPVGTFQLTGHHHIPGTLHRIDAQRFDLYLLTTYAHGQVEALLDVALEYGVELQRS